MTYEKPFDLFHNMSIIIIVKGREVEWTEDGSEKVFQKRRIFLLTLSQKCDTI